ncbi:hypothetical protein DINM_005128 [Dirofilaria immitis]|nr:hypothetical protein [Dirofilaria immitis]
MGREGILHYLLHNEKPWEAKKRRKPDETYASIMLYCPRKEKHWQNINEVKAIFKNVAMNIREFLSKDQSFNKAIAEQDRIEGPSAKILGRKNNSWDQTLDENNKETWKSLTTEWPIDVIELPRLGKIFSKQ